MNARHICSRSRSSTAVEEGRAAPFDLSRSTAVGALRVANENCVSGRVGHARDRRRRLALGDRAHRLRARGPSRGAGSRGSCGCSGTRCTWTVASVMIPSRPSLPSTISRTLGPVDVLGTGRVTSVPAGVTTRTARVRSATSPYLSDCMPDERVAIQPPSVEWVKLSGKWPSVQPRRVELLLELRAEHAGLHAREARPASISSTRSMRPRSTRDDRAVLAGGRLEAAGDVRAAAERDDDRVGVERGAQDRRDLRLVARAARRRRAAGRGRRVRWRTRSRRLLPRAWTTRSSASAETWAAPTAASSAARRSGASAGSGTSSSSKPTGRDGERRRRRARWRAG